MGRGAGPVVVLAALLAACAHESVWLGDPQPSWDQPAAAPAGLTMAVVLGSFEESRADSGGIIDRFTSALRDAHLFQGVMYPVPAGVEPTWKLRLSGSDSAFEPNSNFWKSALAHAVLPIAFFVTLENDYTLELEALVIKDGTLFRSYRGEAVIRNRYQIQAPRQNVDAEGMELAVGGATQAILAQLAGDLPELLASDRL
jgi:hypothetical protein